MTTKKVANVLATIFRVMTIPPFLYISLAISFTLIVPNEFNNPIIEIIMMTLSLCIVPLLAYPLSFFIPEWKAKGRPFQRKLAFITGISGYLIGIIWALVYNVTPSQKTIFFSYFLTVVILILFNKGLKFKASAHGAGVVGPLLLMILLVSKWMAIGCLPLYFASFWSSIYLKRHTKSQLLIGSLCAVVAVGLSYLLFMVVIR